ncbi:ATP-binding cassette domain-containing protein, partial [Escherichia coli]|nr:ATP-binding cassette domain-containing protein [Escherichia coli]
MGQRIDVNHENIYYGDFLAVEDVNINIEPNKVTAFIGPSGCGKSTTLRALAGLEPVSSGRILIDGKDVTSLEPGERDIAMVFQNY